MQTSRNRRMASTAIMMFGLCFGLPLAAGAENYVSRLKSELSEKARRQMRELRDEAIAERYYEANLSGNPLEAYVIYTDLINDRITTPPQELYFFMQASRALALEAMNRHPEAVALMEQVRGEVIDEKQQATVRYLLDLEIARTMAQSGGHSLLPEFKPTYEDLKRAYQRLFDSYDSYQREMLDARLELAYRARGTVSPGGDKEQRIADSREQYEILLKTIKEIAADPTLVKGRPISRDELVNRYMQSVRTHLPRLRLAMDGEIMASDLQKPIDETEFQLPEAKPVEPKPDTRTPEEKVREEFTKTYDDRRPNFSETGARKFIDRQTVDLEPILASMLGEPIESRLKGKIAFYLGIYLADYPSTGTGLNALTGLFERTVAQPVNEVEMHVLTFAMHGLGFSRDPRALEYLRERAMAGFWKGVAISVDPKGFLDRTMPPEPEEVKFRLRECAVVGIGVARNDTAIAILRQLKKVGGNELQGMIDGMLDEAIKNRNMRAGTQKPQPGGPVP